MRLTPPLAVAAALAAATLAAPAIAGGPSNPAWDEVVNGELSGDPAAPTAVTFLPGENTVIGTVGDTGDARDYLTFQVPAGMEINRIGLFDWSPDNIGFLGLTDGPTSFIPSAETNDLFLAGIHVDQSLTGQDLLPEFVNNPVTTNGLAAPRLGPGVYTWLIQQTSPVATGYVFEIDLEPIGGLATGERLVQIRSIDFDAGLIELFNFGAADVDLTGWRFCSHDVNEERKYSGAAGLNGVTIEGGTSLVIHYENDAPAGDPDAIDRFSLGGAFASPLDQDAFGMQIFFPARNGTVAFNNSDLIADAIQWNIPGMPIGTANFRTDQATSVGLWTGTNDAVATTAGTAGLVLNDTLGGLLHGPRSYDVIGPACPGDVDGSGDVDFQDLVSVLAAFGSSCTGCPQDVDGSGDVGFSDLLAILSSFGPCPS